MFFYSLSGSTTLEKENVVAVILAAGHGKRMKSEHPKVAHTLLGTPLIYWPLYSLVHAGVKKIVVVISPAQKQVVELIDSLKKTSSFFNKVSIEVAFQTEALGTGHAAKCALPHVEKLIDGKQNAHVLVTLADMPAVKPQSYLDYINTHLANKFSATVLGFRPADAKTYGRILCKPCGAFEEIREYKDCNQAQRNVSLCNSGFMCSTYASFRDLLPQIKNQNAANEFYLTDLPKLALDAQNAVGLHILPDANELEGVNSQQQLADVAAIIQKQILTHWLECGVQILNPQQVYIEPFVSFDPGVIIEPFVYLAGSKHFSKGTRIKASSRLDA